MKDILYGNEAASTTRTQPGRHLLGLQGGEGAARPGIPGRPDSDGLAGLLGMSWDGERQMIFDWFKSNAPKAAEAEAALPESAREAMLRARGHRQEYEDARVMDETEHMTLAFTRSPDEARAHQFALDLIRRRGPAEAARIAAQMVRYVQFLSREPK